MTFVLVGAPFASGACFGNVHNLNARVLIQPAL
jgi:hypothetical protein